MHPFYKPYSKQDLTRALTRILARFHFVDQPYAESVADEYVRDTDLRTVCHVAAVVVFRDWVEGMLIEESKMLRDALWDLGRGDFCFNNSASKRRREF